MRISPTVVAGVAAATTLAAALSGCGGHPGSSTSSTSKSGASTSAASVPSSAPASSGPVQPNDYTKLLIQASEIDAPVTFKGGPPTSNPNGQPGAATTFSDDDGSHQIKDTIQVFADPAAATKALDAAKGAQGDVVKNPTSRPVSIGTGGTTLSGDAPDGSKGVTVLLFTEGRALVTLEFDGPAASLAPDDFVTDVGQKQAAAVKKGLGG